jgi:hypothetical protein
MRGFTGGLASLVAGLQVQAGCIPARTRQTAVTGRRCPRRPLVTEPGLNTRRAVGQRPAGMRGREIKIVPRRKAPLLS